MVTNGQVPPTQLSTVASGVQLITSSAHAYKAMRILATLDGIVVKPAAGVGSGYRSLAIQKLFWDAYNGDRSAAQKVGLNSASNVRVAAPGYSSHGFGTRIDLLFNNSTNPNRSQLILAERFGFTREFGSDDPNHFRHDGHTAINGANHADQVRVIATYLNSRHLGKHTNSAEDGDDSNAPNYWWLVQEAGRRDGIYFGIVDGKPYRLTWAARDHYWKVLSDG